MEEAIATPAVSQGNGAVRPRWPRRSAIPAAPEQILDVELSDLDRERAAEAVDRFLEPLEAEAIEPGTTGYFDAAEIVEGALPEQARAALTALRRRAVAAVVIRGLPWDSEPGPTPTHADEPPTPPRRGNAWLAMSVRRLGHEFGYTAEKKGSLVHNIHPTREGARTQSNASFTVDLSLHTENAFHPIRPDYVTLFCVRTPAGAPATRLVLLDEVLDQLTDHEIAVLREPRFTIRVVDSHKLGGEADIELPVTPLTGSPRRPLIRWHETLRATDDVAARVCMAFADAAQRCTRYVRLERGDMLAFANEIALHGRDKFDAALDGTDRWLLRGFSIRDLNRTASFVAPARPRVTRVDLAANGAA